VWVSYNRPAEFGLPRVLMPRDYSRPDPAANDPFWQEIRTVRLNDGRMARNVILPLKNHHDHFHWAVQL
jgi:hypothetical protein